MSFERFALAVNAKYAAMAAEQLFVVGKHDDTMEKLYIASFPEGMNVVFRERTEHDCTACNNFIRNIGSVVTISPEGKIDTVWNVPDLEYPYDVVAKALDSAVRALPVTNLFVRDQKAYGREPNTELQNGAVLNWSHLFGRTANRHFSHKPDTDAGEYRTKVGVFKRALMEVSPEAYVETLRLIRLTGDDRLYRGKEYEDMTEAGQKLQTQWKGLPEEDREAFIWAHATDFGAYVFGTSIGSLLEDITKEQESVGGDILDVDLTPAVGKFEYKVDPTRHQRTSGVISPAQAKIAIEKIDELGLRASLNRRHARLTDITVNNVLWASEKTHAAFKDPLADLLKTQTKEDAPSGEHAREMDIAQFMAEIAPSASSIDAFIGNNQMGSFMSLTAPEDKTAKNMFKWDNGFAWSYSGNYTDAIRERVKNAGGNVDNALLRVSLSWSNYDDLDIHAITPSGLHIFFRNKADGRGRRVLDVDMNAGHGATREPVENLSWTHLEDGKYQIFVHNFNRREQIDVGYTLQVATSTDFTAEYHSVKSPGMQEQHQCLLIEVKNGVPVNIGVNKEILQPNRSSKEKWGVQTNRAVPVQTIMQSPNFWDEQTVGNKHWFFILEGCVSDESTRGFYNEYLMAELGPVRRTFEVLADKTKCPASSEQLSGVGFSSTKPDKLLVRVTSGGKQQFINILF